MANYEVGIKNSWSLVSFARSHGTPKLATFVNGETGESFKALAFCKDGDNNTLVGFSSHLGELTVSEIVSQKNNLQVVQLENGHFKLCKMSNTEGSWITIDLGI